MNRRKLVLGGLASLGLLAIPDKLVQAEALSDTGRTITVVPQTATPNRFINKIYDFQGYDFAHHMQWAYDDDGYVKAIRLFNEAGQKTYEAERMIHQYDTYEYLMKRYVLWGDHWSGTVRYIRNEFPTIVTDSLSPSGFNALFEEKFCAFIAAEEGFIRIYE